jgi:ribA/ribD-fused uncharacterized protein
MNDIKGFTGEFRWMSNFWPSPFEFNKNLFWPTVEHAYVAHKAHPKDLSKVYARIIDMTPGQAKRYGRTFEMRPDFDQLKLMLMQQLQIKKYSTNEDLLIKLIETGSVNIEETNTWNDTFWGVCNGVGENHMGKILMGIREHYGVCDEY